MSARERVTWDTCPMCGLSAAVGWRDGVLVAVDCPGGCRLTAAMVIGPREVLAGHVPPAAAGRSGRPAR